MRTFTTVVVAAVATLAFIGLAAAHSPSANASCNSIQDETHREVMRLPLLGLAVFRLPIQVDVEILEVGPVVLHLGLHVGSTYYLTKDLAVFRESNDFVGLQTHDHTCRPDTSHHNFATIDVPADEFALSLNVVALLDLGY